MAKVILVNLDDTTENHDLPVEEVGIIQRDDRYYRYHGQCGQFKSTAIFTEAKILHFDSGLEHEHPLVNVVLRSEQSPEPVPSYGGDAVATYWYLSIEGVEIARDTDHRRWITDPLKRRELTRKEYAPRHLLTLFNQLVEALK